MHPDSWTLRVTLIMIKKHWLSHQNLVITWDIQFEKGKIVATCELDQGKPGLRDLPRADTPQLQEKIPPEWNCAYLFFQGFWELHIFTVYSRCCVEYSINPAAFPHDVLDGVSLFHCPVFVVFGKEIHNSNKWELCLPLYHHGNCECTQTSIAIKDNKYK